MNTPLFLTTEDILYFHEQEINLSKGASGIREMSGVEACSEAPKASFGGEYLLDIFGMADTYISCLTMRHPFVDGNKRAALASALVFLDINGFSLTENHDEELADMVLDFVTKKITKEEMAGQLQQLASYE